MRRIMRFVQISGFVIGVQAALACAVFAAEKAQWSPTEITDIKSISGKWRTHPHAEIQKRRLGER